MPSMSKEEVAKSVEMLAQEATEWANSLSAERIRAMEYYDGVMNDTPSEDGRSSVVSRDFRAATKKVLPSITRTIFGSDRVVEFAPVGQMDEEGAKQAEDYINNVVMMECYGEEHIRDAVHDALRLRNGILKWWWDKTKDVKTTKHTGLTMESLTMLMVDRETGQIDPDLEIIDQQQGEDGTLEVTLRRTINKGRVQFACIPLEEFFVSPDALSIDGAVFVAHNQRLKRYQLVAMGYDREKVAGLKSFNSTIEQDMEVFSRRGEDVNVYSANRRRDLEDVDYWECFVRIDEDDDGIAELRRIVFAGGWGEDSILEDDECEEAPFTDLVIERRPHEWQGRSLFDDIYDIQRVKTVFLRNTLDNISWQNNLQPIFQEGVVQNPDALYGPKFGMPIRVARGTSVSEAVSYNVVPFIAAQAFEMLAYMDDALTDRTGISDNSGGLAPDALQNVTAKASALMEQQGISQIELMVRNVAVGLKRLFRGLLKLIIQHQDKPRMVRLRDQWVQFDPKSWNADMDASVNVGLGAGTRERDMMAMGVVLQTQEKLLMAFGADSNPFVTADNVYNSTAKLYQAAGLKNIEPYLTQPTPESVEALKAKKAAQKSPEQIKGEMQMQIEQAKAQANGQLEQMKAQVTAALEEKRMQVEANKEREQRDADLIVKQAEMQNDKEKVAFETQAKGQLEMAKLDKQHQHDLQKLMIEQAFERERMANERKANLEQQGIDADNELEAGGEVDADGNGNPKPGKGGNTAALLQNLAAAIENMAKPKRLVKDPVTGEKRIEVIN